MLIFAAGCAADQSSRAQATTKFPAVALVAANQTLSAALAAGLNTCKLTFHLKAGMTNAEANDAIDAGYQTFFDCLKNKGRDTRTKLP
jgi:hypothetical protein